MAFEFDRYVAGQKMAEGCVINHASTLDEALDKAYALYGPEAKPDEIEQTAFVLRKVTDR